MLHVPPSEFGVKARAYGYVIDPSAQKTVPGDSLKREVFAYRSDPVFFVRGNLVRAADIGEGLVLYHEAGAPTEPPEWLFAIKGCGRPLPGRGFLIGRDAFGTAVTPHLSLKQIAERVMFIRRDQFGGGYARWHNGQEVAPIRLSGLDAWARR
jgi:hypothetical protein